jgi:hypothetical protein
MDEYEGQAQYNVAETCAASISLQQLQDLSGSSQNPMVSPETKMTYGEIKGLKILRVSIARLYSLKGGNIVRTSTSPPF